MFWERISGFGKGSRNSQKGWKFNRKKWLLQKKLWKCWWPAELGVGSFRALCPSKEPAQCEPSRSPGPEHYWQCVSIGVSIGDYHHHKISGVENITMRRVFIWSDLFSCRNIFLLLVTSCLLINQPLGSRSMARSSERRSLLCHQNEPWPIMSNYSICKMCQIFV